MGQIEVRDRYFKNDAGLDGPLWSASVGLLCSYEGRCFNSGASISRGRIPDSTRCCGATQCKEGYCLPALLLVAHHLKQDTGVGGHLLLMQESSFYSLVSQDC